MANNTFADGLVDSNITLDDLDPEMIPEINATDDIEAGMLSTLKGFVRSMFRHVGRVFDRIVDYGLKVERMEKTADGEGVVYVLNIPDKSGKTGQAIVTVTPSKENKGKIHIWVQPPNSTQSVDFGEVTDSEMAVMKVLKEAFGDDVFMVRDRKATEGTKTIKVALQTVQSNNEVNVVMTKVTANYSAVQAMQNLDAVIAADEFVDVLTEKPQSFVIVDDGSDELDVEPTEDFSTDDACHACVLGAVVLYNNLKMIHWNAIGKDFFTLHEKLDSYLEQAMSDIDWLGELCMELNNDAPNPGTASTETLITEGSFTIDEGFALVKTAIDEFVACLDMNYVNFDHDIQSEMDNTIRYWRKEANYKVARQQQGNGGM